MNKNNKVWIFLPLVLAAIYLLDFIFYGFNLRDLASAVGFSLLAYGAYKDQERASIVGGVLVIAAFVAKYFF